MIDETSTRYRSFRSYGGVLLTLLAFTSCGQHDDADASKSSTAAQAEGGAPLPASVPNLPADRTEPTEADAPSATAPSATAPSATAPNVDSPRPSATTSAPSPSASTSPPSPNASNDPPNAPPRADEPTPTATTAPSAPAPTTHDAGVPQRDAGAPERPTDLPLAVCTDDHAGVASGSAFSINTDTQQYDRHTLSMRLGDVLRRITTYQTGGDAEHLHYITVTDEHLDALLAGNSITVTSEPPQNSDSDHTHTITVTACPAATPR